MGIVKVNLPLFYKAQLPLEFSLLDLSFLLHLCFPWLLPVHQHCVILFGTFLPLYLHCAQQPIQPPFRKRSSLALYPGLQATYPPSISSQTILQPLPLPSHFQLFSTSHAFPSSSHSLRIFQETSGGLCARSVELFHFFSLFFC